MEAGRKERVRNELGPTGPSARCWSPPHSSTHLIKKCGQCLIFPKATCLGQRISSTFACRYLHCRCSLTTITTSILTSWPLATSNIQHGNSEHLFPLEFGRSHAALRLLPDRYCRHRGYSCSSRRRSRPDLGRHCATIPLCHIDHLCRLKVCSASRSLFSQSTRRHRRTSCCRPRSRWCCTRRNQACDGTSSTPLRATLHQHHRSHQQHQRHKRHKPRTQANRLHLEHGPSGLVRS